MGQQFFSHDRDGDVMFREVAEAVEDFCENVLYEEEAPETLDLWIFESEVINDATIDGDGLYMLEQLLERWDEDYGPEDDYTTPTGPMKEAAKTFAREVAKHYQVCRCIQKGRITVRVAEYLT